MLHIFRFGAQSHVDHTGVNLCSPARLSFQCNNVFATWLEFSARQVYARADPSIEFSSPSAPRLLRATKAVSRSCQPVCVDFLIDQRLCALARKAEADHTTLGPCGGENCSLLSIGALSFSLPPLRLPTALHWDFTLSYTLHHSCLLSSQLFLTALVALPMPSPNETHTSFCALP